MIILYIQKKSLIKIQYSFILSWKIIKNVMFSLSNSNKAQMQCLIFSVNVILEGILR